MIRWTCAALGFACVAWSLTGSMRVAVGAAGVTILTPFVWWLARRR